MKKHYSGFGCPEFEYISYSIDWRCPLCGSADVELIADQPDVEKHCDGGPSTSDLLSLWRCLQCEQVNRGEGMCSQRSEVKRGQPWEIT